jgi:hypothetical protein
MKLEAPVTINGYACILEEDGEICFGESELECQECDFKKENECVPVMIEIVPTDEWADRKTGQVNSHTAYTEALNSLQVDIDDLRKSLDEVGKAKK